MRNPGIDQLVWSNGRIGGFRVVRVDTAQAVADLQATDRMGVIEKNIPFSAIHPLNRKASHPAAEPIVKSA
ncbi:MAG: hypothetical protein ABSG84_09915 [Acidobacteriaceae bacterium]|jgi:hypothetical protein